MHNRFVRSIVAGFIATVVLSILMLIKVAMGLMPHLNVIHMLAGMAHARMGLPVSPVIGWVAHFLIGTVLWGIVFAALYPALPGHGAGRSAPLRSGDIPRTERSKRDTEHGAPDQVQNQRHRGRQDAQLETKQAGTCHRHGY